MTNELVEMMVFVTVINLKHAVVFEEIIIIVIYEQYCVSQLSAHYGVVDLVF